MKKILSALVLVFVMLTSATSAFAAKPQVIITSPWSNDQNHPDYFVTQPQITWTQHDPDAGAYFSTYWVLIRDENWNLVWDSGLVTQNSTANNKSISVPVTLPKGQTLNVSVSVQDNNGDWNESNYIKYLYIQP